MNSSQNTAKLRVQSTIKVRDQNVDIYRGIAILLILAGHLYWTERIASLIYSFHLALFFFVTGFFIEKSANKYNFLKYLSNKIGGILIPYGLSLIAYLVFVVAAKFRELGFTDSILELLKVFLISSSAEIEASKYQMYYWFLPFFFLYSLLLFIVFKYLRKYIFVVYISSIVLALLIYYYFKASGYDTKMIPWAFDKLPFVLPLGILGHAIWKKKELLFRKRNFALVVSGLVLLLGFIYKTDLRLLFYNNLLVSFLLALNGSIFIILLSDFLDKNLSNGKYGIKALLIYLGQNTMLIYLIHGVVYPIWHGRMGSPEGYSTLFNLTAICMSIILTFILKYFIEVVIYSRHNYQKFKIQ